MHSLRQYLTSLEEPHALTRTLGDVTLCRDAMGQALYCAGNSAILFRIIHQSRERTLRCYIRPKRNLEAIYGQRLLREELFVYRTPAQGEWVDVVIGEWIEGQTLDKKIVQAVETNDRQTLSALSQKFDHLALDLLRSSSAHGDLKPENIIVDHHGNLHLIDLDAQFLPQMAGQCSPELGTKAYQHHRRTAEDFDPSIDDYPIALISTALHALATEPALYTRYKECDGLLFTPTKIATDTALNDVLSLFATHGMAAEYRIGQLLLWPTLRLHPLAELLEWILRPIQTTNDQQIELFAQDGLWGYRNGNTISIAPLYDCGFEFSESLAAVRLGSVWHFIDSEGGTQMSFVGCDTIKPFRDGRAIIIRNGEKLKIDRQGRLFEI